MARFVDYVLKLKMKRCVYFVVAASVDIPISVRNLKLSFVLLGFPAAFALQGNRGPSQCETVLATNWCNIRII